MGEREDSANRTKIVELLRRNVSESGDEQFNFNVYIGCARMGL